MSMKIQKIKLISETQEEKAGNHLSVIKETLSSLTGHKKNKRIGKNMSCINASGRKIAKQKGRGKARVRTMKTNINRKGAMAFPFTRSNEFQQTKTKKQVSTKRLLLELIKEDRVFIANNLQLPVISTKKFLQEFKEYPEGVLIDSSENVNLKKSINNLSNFIFIDYRSVNSLNLLLKNNIFLSVKSWNYLQEKYQLEEASV